VENTFQLFRDRQATKQVKIRCTLGSASGSGKLKRVGPYHSHNSKPTMNKLSTIIEEDVWDLLDFSNVTVRRERKPWEPVKMTDTLRRNTANLLEPIAVVRPVTLKPIPIKQLDFSKVTIRRR